MLGLQTISLEQEKEGLIALICVSAIDEKQNNISGNLSSSRKVNRVYIEAKNTNLG